MTEANAVITTLSVAEAAAQVGTVATIFVDLRGDAALAGTGIIPGAVHVRRGSLAFVIDPTSPDYNPIFGADKTFIFSCASGGRSALAAQRAQEMSLKRVAPIAGGLQAWKQVGYALDPYRQS